MKKKTLVSFLLLICLSMLFLANQFSFYSYATTLNQELNNLTAKAMFLVDVNSGECLYEKNSDSKLPVASIVKLMTIHLTCNELDKGNIKLEDKVQVSQKAAGMGGSQVFIEANGTYTVGELLKSTIISSANDASVALAEYISGSEENFVSLMNKTAHELGLTNTNYMNCTGLPMTNQFSSAKDVSKLLSEVIKHKDYHKFSNIWMDKLTHSKGRESELVNTNKLIKFYEGCDGGKTGSTSEAGYCLVATAKRGNMRLIGAILGAKNGKARFSESSQLLNYGFNNFENKKVVDSSTPLNDKLNILGGKQEIINVKAEKDLYVLSKKGDSTENIEIEAKFDTVKAPINIGDKVGTLYVVKDGEIICQTSIISMENVQKNNYLDDFGSIIRKWSLV